MTVFVHLADNPFLFFPDPRSLTTLWLCFHRPFWHTLGKSGRAKSI